MAGEESRSVPLDELIGTSLGAYRIVECIGRGGMGLVYLALRDDDAFQKRVAIKVLKPGMDSEEVLRRFRAERQILASLDHPNIAQLLDGGSTPRGLPFLVMEFVEGRPFHRYCDERRLPVADRLRLFLEVASAVQFAHQNLIVHRDLKPSNILVTAEGAPKLLDFGIAKLLNPELSGLTLMPTAPSAVPMTPEYASPEQLRGEHVGTASDVYALGVLLYETLTGGHPHRAATQGAQGSAQREVTRAILDEEPMLPSLAVRARREEHAHDGRSRLLLPEGVAGLRDEEPERLSRRLRGDLDNIVLRALAKEPSRRYASAFELAEDLRRHLAGQPVSARPATLRYRAGKFVGRHRLGVGIAATFGAGLLVTSVVISLLAVRLARERDRAEQSAAQAEQVTGFLTGLFESADTERGHGASTTAAEMLDEGARRLDTELGKQPTVRAELSRTIGRIYRHSGRLDRAEPLLRSALRLSREAFGADHEKTAEAMVDLASLLRSRERHTEARALLDEAVGIQRRRWGPTDPVVARTEYEIGMLCWRSGDLDEAERLLSQAVKTRRGREPVDALELAGMLTGLGILNISRERVEEAETFLREALELRQTIFGADHPALADSFGNLALVSWARGDVREAERYTRQALELRRLLVAGDHAKVADNLTNLGALLKQMGRIDEAKTLHREAVEMRRRLSPAETDGLATALENLASTFQAEGDTAGALRAYRDSAEIRRRLFGPSSVQYAWALALLGRGLSADGQLAEARRSLEAAFELRGTLDPAERDADWSSAKGWLARTRALLGDGAAAEQLAREALAELKPKSASWRVAELDAVLAAGLLAQRRFVAAEALLLRSVQALDECLGASAPSTLQAVADLAALYEAWGKRDEAARWRARLAR